MWKQFSQAVPSDKTGSLGRLGSLLRKMRKDPKLLQQYDQIIHDHLKDGIVKLVSDDKPFGKDFYLPHRSVIREAEESTKVRIMFDVSAKENDQSPSLNDVTDVGPPLLNKLWNVLTRNRMCSVTLTGDLKQTFLQIRIRKEDRDALRSHWIKSIESNDIEKLRFTRAIFGFGESPFLLNGTIKEHLTISKQHYPESVVHIEEIEKNLYVDDLINDDATIEEVQKVKETSIKVFRDTKFKLHK